MTNKTTLWNDELKHNPPTSKNHWATSQVNELQSIVETLLESTGGIWRTADGRVLQIRDMSDEHLKNALEFVRTKSGSRPKAMGLKQHLLQAEIDRRVTDQKWKANYNQTPPVTVESVETKKGHVQVNFLPLSNPGLYQTQVLPLSGVGLQRWRQGDKYQARLTLPNKAEIHSAFYPGFDNALQDLIETLARNPGIVSGWGTLFLGELRADLAAVFVRQPKSETTPELPKIKPNSIETRLGGGPVYRTYRLDCDFDVELTELRDPPQFLARLIAKHVGPTRFSVIVQGATKDGPGAIQKSLDSLVESFETLGKKLHTLKDRGIEL